jgi:hypothetical protein
MNAGEAMTMDDFAWWSRAELDRHQPAPVAKGEDHEDDEVRILRFRGTTERRAALQAWRILSG